MWMSTSMRPALAGCSQFSTAPQTQRPRSAICWKARLSRYDMTVSSEKFQCARPRMRRNDNG
jgi:hypothetical protein